VLPVKQFNPYLKSVIYNNIAWAQYKLAQKGGIAVIFGAAVKWL